MARNSDSNSCLDITVGGSPTQKVSSCPDRWGRWTKRRVRWTPWQGRRCSRSRDSVDHSSRSFKRSFKTRTIANSAVTHEVAGTDNVAGRAFVFRVVDGERVDNERSGSPEKIRLIVMMSLKTQTFWFWIWFRTFWLRLNRGEVVVDDSVVGGEMVDDERSGSPETICLLTNSFRTRTFWFWSLRTFWLRLNRGEAVVEDSVVDGEMVDDERSGLPETICLFITNSFKTRFWFWFGNFWLRLNRGEVVVADNVNDVEIVDDDQSGLPETIRLYDDGLLASWGSNYCIQRNIILN